MPWFDPSGDTVRREAGLEAVGAMRWGGEETGEETGVVVSGIACDELRCGIIRYPIRDDDGTGTR